MEPKIFRTRPHEDYMYACKPKISRSEVMTTEECNALIDYLVENTLDKINELKQSGNNKYGRYYGSLYSKDEYKTIVKNNIINANRPNKLIWTLARPPLLLVGLYNESVYNFNTTFHRKNNDHLRTLDDYKELEAECKKRIHLWDKDKNRSFEYIRKYVLDGIAPDIASDMFDRSFDTKICVDTSRIINDALIQYENDKEEVQVDTKYRYDIDIEIIISSIDENHKMKVTNYKSDSPYWIDDITVANAKIAMLEKHIRTLTDCYMGVPYTEMPKCERKEKIVNTLKELYGNKYDKILLSGDVK